MPLTLPCHPEALEGLPQAGEGNVGRNKLRPYKERSKQAVSGTQHQTLISRIGRGGGNSLLSKEFWSGRWDLNPH